jgi:hypothetical protein
MIEIDEAKAAYVRGHNASAIARAGLEHADADTFRQIISRKIKDSYIYRFEHSSARNVTKFNIILELPAVTAEMSVRFLAGIEYKPENKVLRLITLF